MVADHKEQEGAVSCARKRSAPGGEKKKKKVLYKPPALQEQTKINLENSFQQPHIGTLIQTNLMFPYINNLIY